MKTKGWLLAIALLTVIICVIWWRTSSTHASRYTLRPTFSLAAVSIEDIDNNNIKMNTRIVVTNPLPTELATNRLHYELFINEKKVLESAYDKPLSIQSNDSATIQIPMELLVKPLVTTLRQLEESGADSADYLLKTKITVDLPLKGETDFDFKITKRLPSFRLPKVHPDDIDLKKLSWKESTIKMMLVVDNPNVFPLKMKNVSYDIKLENDIAMHGESPGLTNIPAKSSARLPVYLEVKNPEMLRLISKTLIGKADTKFNLDFTCDLISRNKLFQGSKIAMHTEGTLKEIKKAIKSNRKEL